MKFLKSLLECSSEGNFRISGADGETNRPISKRADEISSPCKSLLLQGTVFCYRLNRREFNKNAINQRHKLYGCPNAGTTRCVTASLLLLPIVNSLALKKAPGNSCTLAIIRCYPSGEDIVMSAAAAQSAISRIATAKAAY